MRSNHENSKDAQDLDDGDLGGELVSTSDISNMIPCESKAWTQKMTLSHGRFGSCRASWDESLGITSMLQSLSRNSSRYIYERERQRAVEAVE